MKRAKGESTLWPGVAAHWLNENWKEVKSRNSVREASKRPPSSPKSMCSQFLGVGTSIIGRNTVSLPCALHIHGSRTERETHSWFGFDSSHTHLLFLSAYFHIFPCHPFKEPLPN